MVLCAYVEMLNLEDHMKGHKFFRQAAQIAVEVIKQKNFFFRKRKILFFVLLDLYSSL
jgi:hypothetical protein